MILTTEGRDWEIAAPFFPEPGLQPALLPAPGNAATRLPEPYFNQSSVGHSSVGTAISVLRGR